MKFLTVKELIAELSEYDGDLIPVILREGNGHYSALNKNDIRVEENVYFPDDTKFPKKQKFLNIGWI